MLITAGIVLIFINSNRRDTRQVEVVRLAGHVESSMLMARIDIDEALLAAESIDMTGLSGRLDSLRGMLVELDELIQTGIFSHAERRGFDLSGRFKEVIAGLDVLESKLAGSVTGDGQASEGSIISAFNQFYLTYKEYEALLPGLLLLQNRQFSYRIFGIVFVILLFLFLSGVIILRLVNRLIRAERDMVKKAIEVESRERERIAADLHDGLGSLLSGLLIHIQVLEKKHAGDEALKEPLKQLNYLSNSAISSIEEVINNLHPSSLSKYGLVKSVSRLIERINKLGRTHFSIESKLTDKRFSESTELFLFRICNELINNALKHSKATRAIFVFYAERKKFHLVYRDDGVGFDMGQLSLEDEKSGLYNLVRRVESMEGRCRIDAEPDKGVEIEIVLDEDK